MNHVLWKKIFGRNVIFPLFDPYLNSVNLNHEGYNMNNIITRFYFWKDSSLKKAFKKSAGSTVCDPGEAEIICEAVMFVFLLLD